MIEQRHCVDCGTDAVLQAGCVFVAGVETTMCWRCREARLAVFRQEQFPPPIEFLLEAA